MVPKDPLAAVQLAVLHIVEFDGILICRIVWLKGEIARDLDRRALSIQIVEVAV